MAEVDLSTIIKAYDVRGVVPEQLNNEVVRAIAVGFAQLVRREGASSVVVAHDMRDSSPSLVRAFADGLVTQGLDVIHAGLASTDLLYFASGTLGIPGAMFTASHNPAQYNGIKMCRAGAVPIGQETGLAQIRDVAEQILASGGAAATDGERADGVSRKNFLPDYANYLRNLVDLNDIRQLTVVVDAGNGMAGYTVPAVLDSPRLQVVPLYFELDGTFPNHEANPLEPANLVDLQKAVTEHGADVGFAFDGDADRCFVVDERGMPVSPSAVCALVAVRELAKYPGESVIHNIITSHAVPEIVREHGGRPVKTRVGHSFIKDTMAREGAIFGGEHSAHYYFRDFWNADTGMLAALHVLGALGGQSGPLSSLMSEYERYAASGEINSTVDNPSETIRRVSEAFTGSASSAPLRKGARIDSLDGLTVEFDDKSWFNLRPSNTEPLLRLNVEAADVASMESLRDDVLAIVRGETRGA